MHENGENLSGVPSSINMNWQLVESRSGQPTAILNGKYLHSRFDPIREAHKTAAAVPQSASMVVLAGLGLGYVAEELLRLAPQRPLIIAEAYPEMIKAASAARDLRALFKQPNVTILVGGNPDEVRGFLKNGMAATDIHLLSWRPSVDSAPDWYNQLSNAVDDVSMRHQINARTLERFGKLWVRNLSANASLLPHALSLKALRNFFSDIPALILAGGPSLELVLPRLKELREKHLLIVVDTALGASLKAGAVPDIVAAVDPQYWNSRHLDRCGDEASDAMIIAEASTHPAVFRTLKGRPIFSRSKFPLGTVLEDAAGLDGELKAGGSVATAAWDLARQLGCSKLSIAGLDLGFPGRVTHYKGSLSRERPHIYSQRLIPAQTMFFHALHDAHPYWVRSMDGNSLLSDRRMDVYAAWFSESAESMPAGNAGVVGGNGRALAGMKIMSIEELLLRPDRRAEIEGRIESIRNTKNKSNAAERIGRSIKKMTLAMDTLLTISEEAVKVCDELIAAENTGMSLSGGLEKLDKIDGKLLSGDGRDIVSFLIQPIIREYAAEQHPGDSQTSAKNSLQRSRRLYSELADSARYHRYYLSLNR